MDIIVTIPKTRLVEVEQEEADVARQLAAGETNVYYYWTLGRRPKCGDGDRCYFVWDGAMRAFHRVVLVARDSETGRWLVWMRPEIHHVKPIPMKSFRGFRYRDRYEDDLEGEVKVLQGQAGVSPVIATGDISSDGASGANR